MRLKERIKEHEGHRGKVYKCTEGFDTIGYGFAIKDLVLSKEVSDKILDEILDSLTKRVEATFDWVDSVPEAVKEVLIEMSYQMGVSGVSKFKLALKAMKSHDWEESANQMLDSRWAVQTPNRAKELSNIVRNQGSN